MSAVQHLRRFGLKTLAVFGYVIQYGCIAHCTFEYLGDFVVCTGPSMEPTIYSDDVIVTEHLTPRSHNYTRGDIIVARSPVNPHQHICKRVVALPGDKIRSGFSSHVVPRGHVWLEGDNRGNSTDSRTFGPLPQGLIRGRVVCKVWPPNDIQLLTYRGRSSWSDRR